MRRVALLAMVVACGRLGFDSPPGARDASLSDGAPIGDSSTSDAAFVCDPLPCTGVDNPADVCNGTCFARCEDMVMYAEAKTRCAAWGGVPMTLLSQADEDCVISFGTYGWLGLEQPLGSPTELAGWAWIDGSPYGAFTGWGGGEPSDGIDGVENDGEQCAHTYGNGDWNDRPCDSSMLMPLVCTHR